MAQACLRNSSCKCPDCAGVAITAADLIRAGDIFDDRFADGAAGVKPPPTTLSTGTPVSAPIADGPDPSDPAHADSRSHADQHGSGAHDQPSSSHANVAGCNAHAANMVAGSAPMSVPASTAAATAPTPDVPTPVSDRPLSDRLADKTLDVKARRLAYSELVGLLRDASIDDALPFADAMLRVASESNMVAMDAGLEAIPLFMATTGSARADFMSQSVVPKLVEKGFAQSRAAVVDKARAAVLCVMEEGGAVEPVVQALLAGLKSRKAKVPPQCVRALCQAVYDFGVPAVDPKPLLAALPSMFEDSRFAVRSSAVHLAVELYRYIKGAVSIATNKCRPAQQKELASAFASADTEAPPRPARYLRKERPAGFTPQAGPYSPSSDRRAPAAAAVEAGAGSGAGAGAGAGAAASCPVPVVDAREYLPAVDLLKQLPKLKLASRLQEQKWALRAAAIDDVLKAIGNVPKLVPGDYGELLASLKVALKDKHEKVGVKAMALLTALVDGLRDSFPSSFAKRQIKFLLARLKDKHRSVVPAVNAAIDAIVRWVVPLDDFMDALATCWASSVTEVRAHALAFLARTASGNVKISDGVLPTVCKSASTMLGDSRPEVRGQAEAVLVAVARRFPDSPVVAKALAGAKASHARAVARIEQAAAGPASAAAPPSPRRVAKPAPPSATASRPSSKSKRPASRSKSKRSDSRGGRAGASASATAGAGAASAPARDAPEPGHLPSPSEAEEALAALNVDMADLDASKWQSKTACIAALADAVSAIGGGEAGLAAAEALTVHLHAKFRKFVQGNMNVSKALFEAVRTASASCTSPTFTRRASDLIIPAAAAKLGDRKLNDAAVELLLELCSAVGPSRVLQNVWSATQKTRSVMTLQGVVAFASKVVEDFSATALDLTGIVDFLRSDKALGGPRNVRVAAVQLAAALYKQLGPAVRKAVSAGQPKAPMSELDAAFNAAGYDAAVPVVAKRAVKGSAAPGSDAAAALAAGLGSIPRGDLGALVSEATLTQMSTSGNKDAWKKRQAALMKVAGILEANPAVEANGGAHTVLSALAQRLNDSNQNLKVKVVNVVGTMAQAVGPRIERFFKVFLKKLLVCMADNRKLMRSAVDTALTHLVVHDGQLSKTTFAAMLPTLGWALNAHTNGREELLRWMAPHCAQSATPALSVLVKPLLNCLQDRASGARSAALPVVSSLVAACGRSTVDRAMMDLKPATARSVASLVASALAAAPAAADEGSSERATMPTSSTDSSKRRAGAPTTGAGRPKTSGGTRTRRNTATSGASKRPSTASASRGGGAGGAAAAAPDDGPLLALGDAAAAKDKRARLWMRRKRMFEEPNAEFVSNLKSALEPTASAKLLAAMFGTKRAALDSAFDMLVSAVHDLADEVVAHLDLILQWCVVRMYESHVQGTARVIALLETLLVMLRASDHRLSDYEAAVFLPFLVERSGSPKDRFRKGYSALMQAVCFVYPASKFVPFLQEGLRSKNNRTRLCCVEQLLRLVRESGWQVLNKKATRQVVALVGLRDHALRTASLELLQEVWLQLDRDTPALFKALGDTATPKIQGLIEEKLKFCKDSAEARGRATTSARSTRGLSPVGRTAAPPTIDPSTPAALGGVLAPDGSPSPATKLAAAFDRTYRHTGADVVGHVLADVSMSPPPTSAASPLPVAAPSMFTMGALDVDATPAAARHRAGSPHQYSLHLSEIQDDMAAHLSQSSGDAGAGAGSGATDASPASPASSAGLRSSRSSLSRPDLTRAISFDNGDVPEFVNWVISGLQTMISMFNEFMNGDAVKLDTDQPAYTHGARVMEALFATCTNRPGTEAQLEMVEQHANQIIHTLTACLHAGFGRMYSPTSPNATALSPFDGKQVDVKYLKKICSTFMELFRVEAVAQQITPRAMCTLMSELTQRLMDPRLANPSKQHEDIIMAINSLALRVSLKARREALMCGLLRLLQRCVAADPEAIGEDARFARKPLPDKVMRLTVKLMMKVQKFEDRTDTRQRMKGAAPPSRPWEHVDCGAILQELHNFFQYHPWATRERDDIPTSAAKAVLRELVKARGSSLREYVAALPGDSPVRPLYLRQMQRFRPDQAADAMPASDAPAVASTSAPAAATPPRPPTTSAPKDAATPPQGNVVPPPAPPAPAAAAATAPTIVSAEPETAASAQDAAATSVPPTDAAVAEAAVAEAAVAGDTDAELAQIFAKLSDPKGLLKEGIEELYKFKRRHPEVDFRPRLAHASEPFRRFILNQLDSMTKRAASRGMVGSPGSPARTAAGAATAIASPPAGSGDVSAPSTAQTRLQKLRKRLASGTAAAHSEGGRRAYNTSAYKSPPGGNEGEALGDAAGRANTSSLQAIKQRMQSLGKTTGGTTTSATSTAAQLSARLAATQQASTTRVTTTSANLESIKQRMASLKK